MLQEDYLLKPLHLLLNEIVAKFTHIPSTLQSAIKATKRDDIYQKYLKQNRTEILNTTSDALIQQFATAKELGLLAEILYQDFVIETDAIIKKQLQTKALAILQHISSTSTNYDMLRAQKIKQLTYLQNPIFTQR